MTDPDQTRAPAGDREPAEPKAEAATEAPPLPSTTRGGGLGRAVGLGLAAALLLVVALAATAPLWAPLLPWGADPDRQAAQALAARLDRLEATQAEAARQAQLQPPRQELAQTRQQMQQAASETQTALQRLGQRVEAVETRQAAPVGDIADLRQQQVKLSQNASELTARLSAVEQSVRTQAARDTNDAALVLALLQIRAAVQAGRPFAAEYDAFAALARSRPELAEAAAGLAEPAKTGVATPTVLAKRLHELAAAIAAPGAAAPPAAPTPASGWTDAALARLRGLVTIRRIDGARAEGAEAAVNAAELALAGGDLAAAVVALDKLTGAAAEAAAPWLRMARQRLVVDAGLRRIEALLTARLGTPTAAPGSSG